MPGAKESGRCWTCKDRKIRCDKKEPACDNCVKSGRTCLGYGFRLSWPRQNDRRRGMIGDVSSKHTPFLLRSKGGLPVQLEFLNVMFHDLSVHNSIVEGLQISPLQYRKMWLPPSVPKPLQWSPMSMNHKNSELFRYYQTGISQIVSTFNMKDCFSVLVKMARADTSIASYAVMQAVCALACLHLHGNGPASKLYTQACATLRSSVAQAQNVNHNLQNITAAMLLALYEIFNTPESSYSWADHVCHAKSTARTIYTANVTVVGEYALLLDWIYYHDVMSQFSIIHYNGRTQGQIACAFDKSLTSTKQNTPNMSRIMGPVGCSAEVLIAISQTFDIVYKQLVIRDHEQPDGDAIDRLDRKLKYAEQELEVTSTRDLDDPDPGLSLTIEEQSMKDIAELFRLAGLIYLNRALKKTSPVMAPVSIYVTDAFKLVQRLDVCYRLFPLFIVACEARDDEKRAEVLRILRATGKRSRIGNILRVNQFIERMWAQDDLDVEQKVDYTDKLTAALSTSPALPTLT